MTERVTLVFDFNWKLTLSVIFVFPALIMLSLWQLDRAAEKKAIKAAWRKQQASVPVAFEPDREYPPYQRVVVTGQFAIDKYWLQENQFYNGQLGYNVVMPFITHGGQVIAVDRGWIKGSPLRDFVPEVTTPEGSYQLTGTLVTPSDSKLIREAESSAKTWPHKILEVDLAVMATQVDLAFYPRLLRIDPASSAAFVIKWRPVNMSPAKHYGYALQWALMAAALLVLYAFASSNLSAWLKARRTLGES